VDLIVGGYLLWYARNRERRNREPVAAVGVLLLLIAGCLTFVSYQVAHRPVVVHSSSRSWSSGCSLPRWRRCSPPRTSHSSR